MGDKEPNRGQRRHSLGREAGNRQPEIDESERARLASDGLPQPGTSQKRRRKGKAKAATPAFMTPDNDAAIGPSRRTERRKADEKAAAEADPRPLHERLGISDMDNAIEAALAAQRVREAGRIIAGGWEARDKIDNKTGEYVAYEPKWQEGLTSYDNFVGYGGPPPDAKAFRH